MPATPKAVLAKEPQCNVSKHQTIRQILQPSTGGLTRCSLYKHCIVHHCIAKTRVGRITLHTSGLAMKCPELSTQAWQHTKLASSWFALTCALCKRVKNIVITEVSLWLWKAAICSAYMTSQQALVPSTRQHLQRSPAFPAALRMLRVACQAGSGRWA